MQVTTRNTIRRSRVRVDVPITAMGAPAGRTTTPFEYTEIDFQEVERMDMAHFSLRQARLHAALPELSQASSFRELCRATVILATEQLGLPRVSFWSVTDDGQTLRLICTASTDGIADSDLREVRQLGVAEHELPVGDRDDPVGYLVVESDNDSPVAAGDITVAQMLADMVGHLARRVMAEEAMLELYRITSESSLTNHERIEKLLRMGLDRFDLEIAILARVTKSRYEVIQVVAPPELELTPGMRFDLLGTFCCETLGALGPVGFTMAEQSNWASHPAYLAFGLEAYLGTPVRVGAEVYGTLNFSSRTPRARTYTKFERKLVQLMARWVQVELENDRNQRRIREHESSIAAQDRSDSIGELATSIAHELNQPLRPGRKVRGTVRGGLRRNLTIRNPQRIHQFACEFRTAIFRRTPPLTPPALSGRTSWPHSSHSPTPRSSPCKRGDRTSESNPIYRNCNDRPTERATSSRACAI